jgi:hypothetical protein
LNDASQTILAPAEGGISLVNSALSGAETAVHFQAVLAARSIAAETLRVNDPDNRTTRASAVFLARNALEWRNFTRSYTGNDRARLKDVVLRSRDGFTQRRNFQLDALVVRLEKRGGTGLIGFDTWRGVDTLSLHTPDFFLDFDEATPIGFGAAQNGPGRVRRGGRNDNGGAFRLNPRGSRLALARIRRVDGYRGLPSMRDIADPRRQTDGSLDFVVEVEHRRDAIDTADRALGIDGAQLTSGRRASQRPSLPNDRLFAISTAQVYFMRPVGRADGRREFSSLYNPYWQVRLAPTSRANRVAAAAAKGLTDPYVALE